MSAPLPVAQHGAVLASIKATPSGGLGSPRPLVTTEQGDCVSRA